MHHIICPIYMQQSLHILNQVQVKYLRAVGSQGWDLMREGEAEKQVNLWLFKLVLAYLLADLCLKEYFFSIYFFIRSFFPSNTEAVRCIGVDFSSCQWWRFANYIITKGIGEWFSICIYGKEFEEILIVCEFCDKHITNIFLHILIKGVFGRMENVF